jgi:hypothetical protein
MERYAAAAGMGIFRGTGSNHTTGRRPVASLPCTAKSAGGLSAWRGWRDPVWRCVRFRCRHRDLRQPDRDAQLRYINEQVKTALRQGIPVISVDTKKKE